jgi:NADPH:quinone reductase-like Zn-dependent oxidoreductase
MIDGLEAFEAETPPLSAHDVRLRVHAVSLNYRDLMVARGTYPVSKEHNIVPCSDGAGEVIAVGSAVSKFKIGDRVAATFFPSWTEGAVAPEKTAGSLGGSIPGMLSEEVVLPETALVHIPDHLDFAEAAALPCTGVTAWNALFVSGRLQPGSTVLLLGTCGVSIMALQLAKAAGLRAIITSSDNTKLERAQELGADATINYKDKPEWQNEVLALTDGRGVDLVLEVGGTGTAARSVTATRMGGTIAIIGGVSGFSGGIDLTALLFGAKQAHGIFVGSRAMFEDLNRFVDVNRIHPVVDRVFAFDQAKEAFSYLDGGHHFGKVVINVRECR